MGFNIYANRAVLVFEGTRYKGAEVTVRVDLLDEEIEAHDAAEDLAGKLQWMVDAGVIESWNLTDKADKPIPLSEINTLPRAFRSTLHSAWAGQLWDVTAPLVPSPDGDI
jgi:hypothetical protein